MKKEEKKVLVLDDDITIRKLITHHLKLNNLKTVEAVSAAEGFQILENDSIDLVLCDVTLGNMDGFTFCEKVRTNANHRFIPFIFVTAKNTFEDKTRAMKVGGDDIITKPFEVDELMLKVQALLKRADIYKHYGVKKELSETLQSKTPQILLVDDDQSLAKIFQYNLHKAGFNCQVANSAEEAFQLLNSFMPDVIISDIMMPHVNGFEFRKQVLQNPKLKSIPFIFLTAKSEEKDILDGYELDITDYVIKTEGPKVIVAKVSAIIKSLIKERQKVISELHCAADSLGVKVIPEAFPEFEKFSVRHWHIPYEGIPGGDFIDYFQIDDSHLAVILGDVMGKKWKAWYFAFAYAGYVRSALRSALKSSKVYSPGTILNEVNQSVYEDAKVSEVFTTLSVLILDNESLTVSYTGAGDLPIIYKDSSKSEVRKIKSEGMLLGFSRDSVYENLTLQLNSGDIIVLTTDGIIETRNKENQQYSLERLVKAVESISAEQDELNIIKQDFDKFTEMKYEDDISLITVRVK
ncbi:heme response regulator HssR [bacterium BMS3Abin03]|nr:heme response regulator HssR [bacterium BMS3Abin03]